MIHNVPEIASLDARRHLVRIPDQLDVPLTERVRRIIDSPQFRRLAKISQLGLVSLVYPAAHHTRFEHSLGVYRIALLYLKQLSHDPRFAAAVTPRDAELLIAAALLHDLGHWPFCHAIEDMELPGVPEHEAFLRNFALEGDVAEALRNDWGLEPHEVVALVAERPRTQVAKILHSLLSGPIDVDKMDYLVRDSLHAGVPYGRNFDQQRLIGSLCLNQAGDGLAISDKGRTAAEMMVFARYVMFSEVYWHHAVRSATAMFQRAFYLLRSTLDLDALFRQSEGAFVGTMLRAAEAKPAHALLDGLFGPTRRLYKRLIQFSFFEQRELYQQLARRPYPWLAACADELASVLARRTGRRISPPDILFDAPPVKLEIEFQVDVHFQKERIYRSLGAVSPVVQALAREQFDDYVKRVRIFAHPRVAAELKDFLGWDEALDETLRRMGRAEQASA